jgi:hypothetical protein
MNDALAGAVGKELGGELSDALGRLSHCLEQLTGRRRIQGFEVTGLKAAIDSVAHFRGHTQEIVHRTRTLLGDRYRFAWVPLTPEQGAPV